MDPQQRLLLERGEAIDVVACRLGTGNEAVASFASMAGSTVRQDGRSASLTAPNGQAQQGVLGASLVDARVEASEIAALEAHSSRRRHIRHPSPPQDELKENVAHHIAYVHQSVEGGTQSYLAQERRNVYTTPKSYLELIITYKQLYEQKVTSINTQKGRLENGLVKLRAASGQVAEMMIQVSEEAIVVEQKKAETDVLLVQVGQESVIADEQAELGAIEDGKSASLTAPNGTAQQKLFRAALEIAAHSPRGELLLESHGTGTSLGDPIEARAFCAGHDEPGLTERGGVQSERRADGTDSRCCWTASIGRAHVEWVAFSATTAVASTAIAAAAPTGAATAAATTIAAATV